VVFLAGETATSQYDKPASGEVNLEKRREREPGELPPIPPVMIFTGWECERCYPGYGIYIGFRCKYVIDRKYSIFNVPPYRSWWQCQDCRDQNCPVNKFFDCRSCKRKFWRY
ncbi:unnamed protein product, partial [Owenia fusiformis]